MRAVAFLVHILTASGTGLALLAMIAAVRNDWPLMFTWLGAALVVDGIDGPLARWFKVGERLPRWSGETLDLVVDYITYVFIPAYVIAEAGMLPPPIAAIAGVLVAVTGALYFADGNMKAEGNYFSGFPAVWNVIVFYLLLLDPGPAVVAVAVLTLCILTFVPIKFVHPIRVAQFRALTVSLLALWALLAFVAVWQGLKPGVWINAALCLVALYFLGLGLLPVRKPT
jgi:phosphatidylcholine synthase